MSDKMMIVSLLIGLFILVLNISLFRKIFKKLRILELPEYKEEEFDINNNHYFFTRSRSFKSSKDLGYQIRIGKHRFTKQPINNLEQEAYIYESDEF